MPLPLTIKESLDRATHFVSITGDSAKDTLIWNAVKQELGQLSWTNTAENARVSVRTGKNAEITGSGLKDVCSNAAKNPMATDFLALVSALDAYRRSTPAKYLATDGKRHLSAEIVFNVEVFPERIKAYLLAFVAA